MKIVIKASWMLGYLRADRSPLTDAELLEELAGFFRVHGFTNISVGDGCNLYDRFFANRSVASVAQYFGIQSPDYQLRDFTAEQVTHGYGRGFGQSTVSKSWKDADFRVSFVFLTQCGARIPIEMRTCRYGLPYARSFFASSNYNGG